MARSQETFNKKEVRSKKEKKKKDKEERRLARKEKEKKGGLEDMMAYVDEFGNITDTPPDPNRKIEEVKVEDIQLGAAKREPTESFDPIKTGVVTFYNDAKGFGFIKDSVTQESIFVHINNTLDPIKEGSAVQFEVEMGQKGPTAVKVKLNK